jgi:uncharacterized protein (DUF433 family)
MNDDALRDRIEANPEVLVGKPVIRGTRISVEFVLGLLAGGWSFEEIKAEYAGIADEDIRACFAFASSAIHRGWAQCRRSKRFAFGGKSNTVPHEPSAPT